MDTMKRVALLSAVLLLASLAVSAEPESSRRFSNRLLTDVVQMSRAGLSEDTIIAYVKARRSRLESDVTADDLIQLRRAGVHENVVRYIAGATGIDESSSGRDETATYDSRAAADRAVEPADGEDYAVDAFGSGYDSYPYWDGWYGYPYWYAYSPFFTGAIVVRGGRFHGRGFVHRGFGRGGGHFSGGRGGRSGGHSGGHGGGHGRR